MGMVNRDLKSGAVGPRSRQRFSDKIEYRRGRRDGEAGLPAASLSKMYAVGYSEGRRTRSRRAEIEEPRDDRPPSCPRVPARA